MFSLSGLVLGSLYVASLASAAGFPPELFSPLIPRKVLNTSRALPNPTRYPQYTTPGTGKWVWFDPNGWTSGFFPATLYELNKRATKCGASPHNGLGIADWLNRGRAASTALIGLDADHGIGHDLGFISFPFVDELAVNPNNQTAINAINRFATLLAARFNPAVGCIRSWDSADSTRFHVIIDNMMNLELLFHSAEFTGNETLREIAFSHADTTIKNHIRSDGSTWHVVDYNSTTGNVINKWSAQGFAESSTWARGHSWGVYGYANLYRITKNKKYLETSKRMANWFLNHLPADGIVPWDFDAPTTPAPRASDSSAAALIANGLLMLSQFETSRSEKQKWINGAAKILDSITTLAWKPTWDSLLSNGTVNMPAGNSLTGIVYGDYYYIKAGNALLDLGLASC